jgi:toxin ParE1/3/4
VFKLDLLEQAEVELSESFDWYEEQQQGLGNRFYKEVNACLESIRNNPELYVIRYDEAIRTATLRVFPFLIIYWIDKPNQTVYIISIFHTSRNPQY